MRQENNKLSIKKMCKNDFDKDVEIIRKLLEQNYKANFIGNFDFRETVKTNVESMKNFFDDGTAIVFGSYLETKLRGFLWAYKKTFFGEKRIHISHIIIDKRFRGLGIGSKIIRNLETYATKKGIHKIELITSESNKKTLDFYTKHGFSIARFQFEKKVGE